MNDHNILSVYVSSSKGGQEVVDQMQQLAEERDRSLSYLVVEAILQYVDNEDV